jgi:dUTP pyrophosphatase
MMTPDVSVDLEYVYKSVNPEPSYAYPTDSGFDLYSLEEVRFAGFERKLVSTGLFVNIPEGFEIQVRTKSGLAINQGLVVLNSPGTVDQGYTGEIKVILMNMNNLPTIVSNGQKIAQAVLCPVVQGKNVNLKRVLNINDKDRNENGFGSTGK